MAGEAFRYDLEGLSRAHEDALFQLAVVTLEAKRAEAAARAADAGCPALTPEAMDAAYLRGLPRLRARMRREKRRAHARRAARGTLPRAATVVAGVLALALIGGISALALSGDARRYLSKLLVSPADEFTDFRFAPEATQPVPAPPAGYTGDFFPAYIPPEYRVTDVFESRAVYEAPGGGWLCFDELSFHTALGLDTEDAIVTYSEVGGTDAMVVEKNGRVSILWAYPDRFFLVMLNGSRETAMLIAESVVLVD